MKRMLGVVALFIATVSCSSDLDSASLSDCSLVDCASGNLLLQFLDGETEEDVFFNGTYNLEDVVITDLETNEDFVFFTGTSQEFETAQIALNTFFESRNNVMLRIAVPDGFETTLSFDVTFIEGECCNVNNYTDVSFTNVTSVDDSDGDFIYKIFL